MKDDRQLLDAMSCLLLCSFLGLISVIVFIAYVSFNAIAK